MLLPVRYYRKYTIESDSPLKMFLPAGYEIIIRKIRLALRVKMSSYKPTYWVVKHINTVRTMSRSNNTLVTMSKLL